MKIFVDQIQDNKPYSLHVEEPVESFPVLAGMQQAGEITFNGPILSDITIKREYDHLRANGRVTVPATLSCSRCLAGYALVIDSTFTIIFRKGLPLEEAEEDEIELGEQDLISTSYSGNEIDFTHEIEEQVSMEIPLKPLCSEGCKGLCPTCGVDFNKGSCDCARENINLKFGALKDFKVSR